MKYLVRIFRVDATRNYDGGWTWNSSASVSTRVLSREQVDRMYSPRVFLRTLRERGFLSEESKGKISVEFAEGDPTTISACLKGTGEPLFAMAIYWDDLDQPAPAVGTGLANHRSPFGGICG